MIKKALKFEVGAIFWTFTGLYILINESKKWYFILYGIFAVLIEAVWLPIAIPLFTIAVLIQHKIAKANNKKSFLEDPEVQRISDDFMDIVKSFKEEYIG